MIDTLMELARKYLAYWMERTGSSGTSDLSEHPIEAATRDAEPSDFIRTYVTYADVLEAPTEMHEVVGIQLVASVLNRNGVRIAHGPLEYPLDLWTLLLSGSGGGRNTLVALADPILTGARLSDVKKESNWGSAVAMYQQLAEVPHGLFVWGELSEKLKLLGNARFGGLKQWLTDRYDNLTPPDNIIYRRTGKGNDTPEITFGTAPRTNILATSSEAWFFEHLEQEDTAGGFVPRWLLVRADRKTRDVPTPTPLDLEKRKLLIASLHRIDRIRGVADLSGILSRYEREWYSATRRRFLGEANSGLAGAFFARHRVHLLKLAVIFEVSQSGSLRVTDTAWDRAVACAARLEETIFSLVGTGMNRRGYALSSMENVIRDAGPEGVTKTVLTRAFQSLDRRDREQNLQTLKDAGQVLEVTRQTSGRSATVFIHVHPRLEADAHVEAAEAVPVG